MAGAVPLVRIAAPPDWIASRTPRAAAPARTAVPIVVALCAFLVPAGLPGV